MRGASFNGFTKIPVLKSCSLGFPVAMLVVETVLYYLTIAIGAYCMFKIHRDLENSQTFDQVQQT